jgi:CRP-like cAMP-binding protein
LNKKNIWQFIEEISDPFLKSYSLDSSVEVSQIENNSKNQVQYVIKSLSNTYLKITHEDYFILNEIKNSEGGVTTQDLSVSYFMEYGQLADHYLNNFIQTLYEGNFLNEKYSNIYSVIQKKIQGASSNFFKKKTWSFGPEIDVYVTKLHLKIGPILFSTLTQTLIGLFCLISFVGLPIISHYFKWEQIFKQSDSYTLGILTLLLVRIFFSVVHELFHALMLKHFGGRILAAGITNHFGFLNFFVDTSDIWMKPKLKRILVSFMGPYSGVILSSFLILGIWWKFPLMNPEIAPVFMMEIYIKMIFWGLWSMILNLNPLLYYDGYYILIDLINFPMLRNHAFKKCKDFFSKIHKTHHLIFQFNSKNFYESLILGGYFFLSILWIGVSLLLGINLMGQKLQNVIHESLVSQSLLIKIFSIGILILVIGPTLISMTQFLSKKIKIILMGVRGILFSKSPKLTLFSIFFLTLILKDIIKPPTKSLILNLSFSEISFWDFSWPRYFFPILLVVIFYFYGLFLWLKFSRGVVIFKNFGPKYFIYFLLGLISAFSDHYFVWFLGFISGFYLFYPEFKKFQGSLISLIIFLSWFSFLILAPNLFNIYEAFPLFIFILSLFLFLLVKFQMEMKIKRIHHLHYPGVFSDQDKIMLGYKFIVDHLDYFFQNYIQGNIYLDFKKIKPEISQKSNIGIFVISKSIKEKLNLYQDFLRGNLGIWGDKLFSQCLDQLYWSVKEPFEEYVLRADLKNLNARSFQYPVSQKENINFLKSIGPFREMEETLLNWVLNRLVLKVIKPGEVIVEEGSIGEMFYVVLKGQLEVVSDNQLQAHLSSGDIFGERALYLNLPRSANVNCIKEGELWCLNKCDFLNLLNINQSFKLHMENYVHLNFKFIDFLRTIPLLKKLSDEELREMGAKIKFQHKVQGDIIFEEGESGESFYIIKEGAVEVYLKETKRVLSTLGTGEFFGEMALFRDIKRTASVRVTRESLLFELKRNDFQKTFNNSQLMERISSRRLKDNDAGIKGVSS